MECRFENLNTCLLVYIVHYILINLRLRNSILYAKSMPGADCGSDHNPAFCPIKLYWKNTKKGKYKPTYLFGHLTKDPEITIKYATTVPNTFQQLNNVTDIEEKFDNFKDSIAVFLEKNVPLNKIKTAPKNGWQMNYSTWWMREKKVKIDASKYKDINKLIKNEMQWSKRKMDWRTMCWYQIN